jgi:hypothetical protein
MATKGTGFTIPFKIIVASTGANAGDEAANLTVYLIADGVRSVATNAPAYEANGWHSIAATDAEANCDTLALDATCTTSDRFIQPVSYSLQGGAAGSGANTVTVTVRTSGGVVFAGVKVSAGNQTETNTPLVQYTSALGQVTFYCDAGAWRFVAAATAAQGGGATNVTVDGAEAVTVTVTAATIPAPVSADNYLLYGYETKLKGDGALADVVVTLMELTIEGRNDAAGNKQRTPNADSDTSDASGLWHFEIAKTAVAAGAQITVRKTWTDAEGKAKKETWMAMLDVAKVAADQLSFADLAPRLV